MKTILGYNNKNSRLKIIFAFLTWSYQLAWLSNSRYFFAGSTAEKQWGLWNIQTRNWEGRHSYLWFVSYILYFKLVTQNDAFLHLVLGSGNGLIILYCSLYVDPDGKIYEGAQKGKRFLKKQVWEIRCFSHRACWGGNRLFLLLDVIIPFVLHTIFVNLSLYLPRTSWTRALHSLYHLSLCCIYVVAKFE